MARSIFIAFHYQQDIWRVNVVRNHYLTKGTYKDAGYWDHSLWEETKKKGDDAIKKIIKEGMKDTTVTVVLIGSQTAQRKWVNYEILESHNRGNGMLGIYIHQIKDKSGLKSAKGQNPFGNFTIKRNGQKVYLSEIYPTYDWIDDDGYKNFGSWVEKAAKAAGH
jgi:hypothetical protein